MESKINFYKEKSSRHFPKNSASFKEENINTVNTVNYEILCDFEDYDEETDELFSELQANKQLLAKIIKQKREEKQMGIYTEEEGWHDSPESRKNGKYDQIQQKILAANLVAPYHPLNIIRESDEMRHSSSSSEEKQPSRFMKVHEEEEFEELDMGILPFYKEKERFGEEKLSQVAKIASNKIGMLVFIV